MEEIMEKSQGHIKVIAGYEYFIRNGELFRARIELPVMPDGYRCGRWQTRESMADDYIKMIQEVS
jgi:hypothetical protein